MSIQDKEAMEERNNTIVSVYRDWSIIDERKYIDVINFFLSRGSTSRAYLVNWKRINEADLIKFGSTICNI